MITFEEIIGNLLLRHNCVVIPTFGGFVAKQISAQIDYQSGVMLPPKKSLLFNRQLINNDGLLISEYAKENHVSYAESEIQVKGLIQQWNSSLKEGNRVTIDRVGFLYFDSEKNICFEQDRFFNLLLSAYGLGKVHFLSDVEVKIAKHHIEAEPIKSAEIETIVPKLELLKTEEQSEEVKSKPVVPITVPVEKSSKQKLWKYVAAACVLPLVFYSIWIPMKTDVLESKIISFHDFNPFHQSSSAQYNESTISEPLTHGTVKSQIESLATQIEKVAPETEVYTYNFSDQTFIKVRLKEVESPVDIIEKEHTVALPASNKKQMNYIVGCFADEGNAEQLVSDLKKQGFDALIFDKKGGLNRVSIGAVNTQPELQSLVEKSKSAGFDGWVLK